MLINTFLIKGVHVKKALKLILIGAGLSPAALLYAGTYTVIDLSNLGMGISTLSAPSEILDNNEVIGSYTDAFGDSHACTWTVGGGVQVLQTIPGYLSASATAGNLNGQVVGSTTDLSGDVHACLWSKDGTAIDIGSLIKAPDAMYSTSRAVGVNQAGQVAGYYLNKQGTYSTFLYTASSGAFQYFTNVGNSLYPDFQATSINNAGQIAGGDYDGPCIVAGGSLQLLGTYHGNANAVNNGGQATGWFFDDPNNYTHAFVWSGGAAMDIGTSLPKNTNPYADANSSAGDINDNGQVVGTFDYDGIWQSHGFLWTQGGGMIDVNTLLSSSDATKYTVAQASGINDNGWILATVNGGDSVVLAPQAVPEPCTVAALGGGLFTLIMRRRRRR